MSRILLAALVVFAMAGCNPPQDDQPDQTAQTVASILADTSWRLVAIGGERVSRAGAGATLNFNANASEAGGSGTCNTFGTRVLSEGTRIDFSPVIATERACLPQTRMLAEGAYFTALDQAMRFEVVGNELVLTGDKGEELLRFEGASAAPVEQELIGTRWSLGDLEGTPAFGLAHIAFGENGELAGQGPCNGIAGDYRLGTGRTTEIMPVKTTRCFCDEFDRENRFLDALRRVETWRIDGERLLLEAAGQTLMILEFERAAPTPLRGC